MTFARARAVILEGRACQFDPAVVDAFAVLDEQDVAEVVRRGGEPVQQAVNTAVERLLRRGEDAAPSPPRRVRRRAVVAAERSRAA